MSEEDWGYLESLMDGFGALLSDIPYGHRDKAWWSKFYEFSDLIKKQIKKVQPWPIDVPEGEDPCRACGVDEVNSPSGTCKKCPHNPFNKIIENN